MANFNEHSRPEHIYHSSVGGPLVLTEPSAAYGITSMRGPLTECTVTEDDGGLVVVTRDESITKRPAFRFTAEAGTYEIACTPDLYFEVFRGEDLVRAARGYDGPVHPSVYFLAAATVTLGVGSFLWNRFVQRPRDWSYTPAE